ncbi:MAG: hypothetical protein AAF208_06350 [Cyanobacteria bacterium P01_A01_bin.45]
MKFPSTASWIYPRDKWRNWSCLSVHHHISRGKAIADVSQSNLRKNTRSH